MSVTRKRERREIEKIARERMEYLMRLADDVFLRDRERAQRYVEICRRLGMRSRVRIPRAWRWRICRGCKAFLWPGVNCRVRLRVRRQSHIVVTCFNCGHHMRYNI